MQHRAALAQLQRHLGTRSRVDQVTCRIAGAFVSDVLRASDRKAKTVNRIISSLSSFWRWLVKRGFVEDNPWAGQGSSRGGAEDPSRSAATRPTSS